MSISFSQIQDTQIPRARFDLSHEVKTTLNQGELVPFYASEVLPGDKFKLSAEVFLFSQIWDYKKFAEHHNNKSNNCEPT